MKKNFKSYLIITCLFLIIIMPFAFQVFFSAIPNSYVPVDEPDDPLSTKTTYNGSHIWLNATNYTTWGLYRDMIWDDNVVVNNTSNITCIKR